MLAVVSVSVDERSKDQDRCTHGCDSAFCCPKYEQGYSHILERSEIGKRSHRLGRLGLANSLMGSSLQKSCDTSTTIAKLADCLL